MISFLQPLALLGLALATVPPLLHLLARRVPPVIAFPSLRYLTETERRQSRKLKLRHLLLMILRTLIIVFIALAASRPIARIPFGNDHEPAAVGIVLDNSLSSGAIVAGRRVLDELVDRARHVLSRTDPDDRVWLTLADAIPRRMAAPEVRALLDTLTPRSVHLDLVAAARTISQSMENDAAASREVVVISDLQRTAIRGEAETLARTLVWRAPATVDENRGIDSAWSEPPVWAPSGQVVGAIGGFGATPTTVHLSVDRGPHARSFGAAGDVVIMDGAPPPGWHRATVGLDPDELRADDEWRMAVHVAPPAGVSVTGGAGVFVRQSVDVLRMAGRVRDGTEVVLTDQPTGGAVVLFPPEDPALIGAVNRALRDRGSPWQFGELVRGEWALDSGWVGGEPVAVTRRRELVGGGDGDADVIVTAGGEPWMVRSERIVIVASRLHPRWSNLPVTAAFVPFMDRLINRVAARESYVARATPGEPVRLPPGARAMLTGDGLEVPVEPGRIVAAPFDPGVYFLRGEGGDTIGALEVNHDPRESILEPASDDLVQQAFGSDTWLLNRAGIDRELFSGARRADLTGILILLAVVLAVTELIVATIGGGRAAEG